MSSAATESLLVVDRPRFTVDGEPRDSFSVDLVSLEVCEDEEGVARLELVLVNWGQRRQGSEPGFLYFDGSQLDLGSEVAVTIGAPDVAEEVFRGVITAVEGVYRQLAPPQLVLRAEDALMWARVRQHTRVHEQATDADVARTAAEALALASEAQASGPTHEQLWQVNRSDLGLLRERARAVDARVGVVDGKLAFVPRRGDGGEPIALSRASDLVRCEVCADLAHQRTEVRVHGWSVRDKAGIHESAGASDVQSEAEGGRLGGAVLDGLGIDAIEDHHDEMPVTSEEAVQLARALMKARARRFVVARGTTDGTPTLRVASRVHLTDLGPWFDGIYHVCNVRHVWDQTEGYRTHFVAERPDLGRPA